MLAIDSLITEIVFWVGAALLMALITLLWNRLSTNTWQHLVGRFSLVLALQFFVITALGVTINRAGDFYDSWTDIFGSKNDLVKIAVSPEDLSLISSTDIASASRTSGGSLMFRKVITGAQSGISSNVYVVASPQIAKRLESPAHTIGSDYQVDELFPGTPGIPQTWVGALNGVATMESLENSGQIGPTLLVIPAINVVPGRDTECLNFIGGPQVESWITSDMRTFMTKFMGVDARKWGAFGYSEGGWCASEAAILHTDQYFGAVSLAGYFHPQYDSGLAKRRQSALFARYDLAAHIVSGHVQTKLLVIASVKDQFANAAAKKFVAEVGSRISLKYIPVAKGAHNTSVARPFVPTGLMWLNSQNPTNSL